MRDVRVARLAGLAGVRGLGEAVGLGEARDVLRLQVREAALVEVRLAERKGRHADRLTPKPPAPARGAYSGVGGGVGLRLRTSVPTLPVAISRSAITVDLSRFGSTSGEAPALSWRAR